MNIFFWILGATFAVSAVAVIAIFFLLLAGKRLKKILLSLVGLSAGALMGGAFLHLLPEAVNESEGNMPYILTLAGFVFFFLMEKFLFWRHCHKDKCDAHEFGYMNVIGDGLHNFIDGLIIAAGFLVDIKFGLLTTAAVMLHEIPQEVGDCGVLLYAGFSRAKALALNYLSAVLAILGGMVGYFLGTAYDITSYLLPLAAGGFIYIASADLLPELKKEKGAKNFFWSFLVFIFGILLMMLFKD